MAKTSQVPLFVRIGNILTTSLLRVGFKLVGPGNYPMYLLTVRGRKSGGSFRAHVQQEKGGRS